MCEDAQSSLCSSHTSLCSLTVEGTPGLGNLSLSFLTVETESLLAEGLGSLSLSCSTVETDPSTD